MKVHNLNNYGLPLTYGFLKLGMDVPKTLAFLEYLEDDILLMILHNYTHYLCIIIPISIYYGALWGISNGHVGALPLVH